MSAAEAALDDMDFSGAEPEQMVPNPYAATHGKNMLEPVDGALAVVFLPVPIGGASPWFSNARGLANVARNGDNWQLIWMLLYVLTGLETHQIGATPNFTIDRKKNPGQFKYALEAHVRDICGYGSDKDRAILKTRFYSSRFDPGISVLINELKKRVKRPKAKGANDDDADGGGDDDSAQDAERARIEAKMQADFVDALARWSQTIVHISSAPSGMDHANWPFAPMDAPPIVNAAALQDLPAADQQNHFYQICGEPLNLMPRFAVDVFSFPTLPNHSTAIGRHYMYQRLPLLFVCEALTNNAGTV
jgi:hypothetical protein